MAKTAEPTEMLFGMYTRGFNKESYVYGGARWRHLMNKMERSVRGL